MADTEHLLFEALSAADQIDVDMCQREDLDMFDVRTLVRAFHALHRALCHGDQIPHEWVCGMGSDIPGRGAEPSC